MNCREIFTRETFLEILLSIVTTLVIVPCGRRKIWDIKPDTGSVEAKDAYQGAPFKVNREYAERFSDKWVILSAKYGFIDPSFIIPGNYNVAFKDPSTNPISLSVLRRQVQEKQLDRFDSVIALGGSDYTDIVSEAFSGFKMVLKKPTEGLPIGKAMQKVKNAVLQNQPFQ